MERRAFDIERQIDRTEPVNVKTFTSVNKELPELESYTGYSRRLFKYVGDHEARGWCGP